MNSIAPFGSVQTLTLSQYPPPPKAPPPPPPVRPQPSGLVENTLDTGGRLYGPDGRIVSSYSVGFYNGSVEVFA